MTNAFVIIAHRGNQSRAPENTTDAFQASLDAGFQHFETDVQLTQDGVPIILHDEQLGRTIPGAGSVAERTWEELKDLDAGSWYCAAVGAHEAHAQITGRVHGFAHCRVPTLEAVLAAFLGRAHIHLELKSQQQDLPAAVAHALRTCGWLAPDTSKDTRSDVSRSHDPKEAPRPATSPAVSKPSLAVEGPLASTTADPSPKAPISMPARPCEPLSSAFAAPGLTITSFHLPQLKASISALAGLRISDAAAGGRVEGPVRHAWLVHELTEPIMKGAAAAGITQLCPRAGLLTQDQVAAARATGFTLRAWGISNDERLLSCVDNGVPGGTLNHPEQARALLTERGLAC